MVIIVSKLHLKEAVEVDSETVKESFLTKQEEVVHHFANVIMRNSYSIIHLKRKPRRWTMRQRWRLSSRELEGIVISYGL